MEKRREKRAARGITESYNRNGGVSYRAIAYINGKTVTVGSYNTLDQAKTERQKYIEQHPSKKKWSDNLTGKLIGHGRALHATQYREAGSIKWLMLCDCGTYYLASSNNLSQGKIVSCGHVRNNLKDSPGSQRRLKNFEENGTDLTALTRNTPVTNTSGYKNISVVRTKKGDKRYIANVMVAGKRHYSGRFVTLEKALETREMLYRKYRDPKIKELKDKK